MSVQKNDYIIVGAKFGFDEFYEKACAAWGIDDIDDFWEVEDDYHDSAFKGIHHHNGLCVIADGMDGKYVYVGHVVNKSGNYGSIADHKIDTPVPSPETVQNLIQQEFGLSVECSHHIFTHYR